MAFSENIARNDRKEEQIKEALIVSNDTQEELKSLKDLVVVNGKLKGTITARGIENTKEISEKNIINILNKNRNKSRNEIYGKNGAGVTFAVQYALQEMGYGSIVGDIDGVIGAKTKAAVEKFQKDWNKKNPLLLIKVDGLAGGKTIEKMYFIMKNPYLWKRIIGQQIQNSAPDAEIESSEITAEDFDPFDPANAAIVNEGAEKIKSNNSNVVNAKAYAYDKEHKQILYYDGASTGRFGRGSYMYSPETKKAHQLLAANAVIDFYPLLTQLGLLKDDRDDGFSLLRKLSKDTINKLSTPSTYSEGWTGLVGERKTAFLNRLRNKPDGKKFVTWINETTMPNPTLNSRYIQEKLIQMSKNYSRWDEVKLEQA